MAAFLKVFGPQGVRAHGAASSGCGDRSRWRSNGKRAAAAVMRYRYRRVVFFEGCSAVGNAQQSATTVAQDNRSFGIGCRGRGLGSGCAETQRTLSGWVAKHPKPAQA
jgi:hypothetical protein